MEPKGEDIPTSISYSTLFRFASVLDKSFIVLSGISAVIAGVLFPISVAVMSKIFQVMIDYTKALQNGTNNDQVFLNEIDAFGTKFALLGLVMLICGYFATTFVNLSALNQAFNIRQAYLKAALNQDFAYYETRSAGDLASKMSADVIKLEEGIGDKLSGIMYSGSLALAGIVMAFLKGWKLALMCLSLAPVSLTLIGISSMVANRLTKKEAIQTGKASAVAEEVLSAIRTIFAFNAQKKELERYKKPLSDAKKILIKKELFSGFTTGLMFFFIFLSYAMSFYLGVYLILNEPANYNPEVILAVFMCVMHSLINVAAVAPLLASIGAARGAGAHIFGLIDHVPTINPLCDVGIKPDTVEGDIELRNVKFHYASRPDVPVLKDVSISVKRGQCAALVGPSGCGKSSIIQLISRFYDVIEGSVNLDGIDIRSLNVNWLRSQIAVVGQEPALFNATVEENIQYGRLNASRYEIEEAARLANAHDFISNLPKNYATLVGECGASLSGGQKQRIAVARALVRRSKILLLDEATSALDTASESVVTKYIEQSRKDRTTIVVAHRLSTIRNADVIYVLQNGAVVETGNHPTLMAKNGLYTEMVSKQRHVQIDESTIKVHQSPQRLSKIGIKKSENLKENIPEEKETPPPVSFLKVLSLNKPEWKYVVAGCIGSVMIGCALPSFILVFGLLFETFAEPDANKMYTNATKICWIMFLIGLVLSIAGIAEGFFFGLSSACLTERLRVSMFEHLLSMDVAYFDDRSNSVGALCARLSAEATYVQGASGQRIGLILQSSGAIGLGTVLGFVFEWKVALCALAFVPLMIGMVLLQNKLTNLESNDSITALEKSSKTAVEAVTQVRTVASLGRERHILDQYSEQLGAALGIARKSNLVKGLLSGGASKSLSIFINASTLTLGGHLMVSHDAKYHHILIATQAFLMAIMTLQTTFTFSSDVQKGLNAASRILLLLNAKPSIRDPEKCATSDFKSRGDASLSDIDFRYPTRPGVMVLKGFDLQIEKGKTYALVGESGCGKSSVIRLLQRFYDPESGVVALDGISIRELRLADVRASYGLVSQEPALFDLSIEENIAYGVSSDRGPHEETAASDRGPHEQTATSRRKPHEETAASPRVPHDEVVAAARQANIHDFIVSLPLGYETNIGSKGVQLSGGQKQRIAIARALLRKPKILLLDEATSALDTESEKVVQEALDAAKAGRTCVLIAHRLSTVRDADVICVVSGGRVVEAGQHQALMDQRGLYFNLHTQGL